MNGLIVQPPYTLTWQLLLSITSLKWPSCEIICSFIRTLIITVSIWKNDLALTMFIPFNSFIFHFQICTLQWPRHVWYPSQCTRGHSQTSYWENCSTANPNRSFLLSGGVTVPVDYLQLHNYSGYWQFLQPQSAPWAKTGWKYDLSVPLGVSKRDAQPEDTRSAQQQTH